MKHCLTLALLMTVAVMSARQFSPEEAQSFANDFIIKKSISTRSELPKVLTRINEEKNLPYFAFNIDGENGYVLVSSSGESLRILGYSDKGSFDSDNLPPQLHYILTGDVTYKEKTPTINTRAEADAVLHLTANWGQGDPYNQLVPLQNTATGCVATAMAIAMQYHQWPDKTRGGEQYNWYFPETKMNFDEYVIDWNALSDKDNPKFADEISKLMLSAGIASHMLYGIDEFNQSGADVWAINQRLIELYCYDKECQYLEKTSFSDSEWNQLLKSQLAEVGPVIYRGGSDNSHCFVIDGYDNQGLFHVNWGWDGNSNGYYALDFSDVGGMNFGDYQGMIINMKPDKEKKEYSKAFITNADVYVIGGYSDSHWNFSSSKIDTGEEIEVLLPVITINGQKGFFRLAIVDENDNIVELLGEKEMKVSRDYSYSFDDAPFCAHPGIKFTLRMKFPSLKAGQRFQIVSQDADWNEKELVPIPEKPSDNPNDYKLVLGGMVNKAYFLTDNNNSEIVTGNFHIDENLPFLGEVNGILEHEFTLRPLKWDAMPENLFVPSEGVTMEVHAYNSENKEVEPIYVMNYDEGYDKFIFTFNISPYEDNYDVYFRYTPADPKRIKGKDPSSIHSEDGLYFEINGEEASIIGYDENIPSDLTLPVVINKDGKDYPVTSIAREALMHAPVNSLSMDLTKIKSIGRMALAGIKNLEHLNLQNIEMFINEEWYVSPYLQSNISNVYSDKYFTSDNISALADAYFLIFPERATIGRRNIDYYFSALPDLYDFPETLKTFSDFVKAKPEYDKVFSSLNIPGVGNLFNSDDFYGLPVTQMWDYAIDKENGLLRLSNIIDNVTIDKVIINGKESHKNTEGLYSMTVKADKAYDIMIEYTVNGVQSMSSDYTVQINNAMESTNLSAGIEEVSISEIDGVNDVYNLQGVKVISKATKEDLNLLPSGIYIIKGKKVVVK